MLWGKIECKRKTHRRKEWSKSNPLWNVEIIEMLTLNFKCWCQLNQGKHPAQKYFYFEGISRKWEYFCRDELIFWDQKIMLVSQKRIF